MLRSDDVFRQGLRGVQGVIRCGFSGDVQRYERPDVRVEALAAEGFALEHAKLHRLRRIMPHRRKEYSGALQLRGFHESA